MASRGLCDPRLAEEYLFSGIARCAAANRELLDLGVGDVTLPLPRVIAEALISASCEMASTGSFRGYSPTFGYPFLRDAISKYYAELGVNVGTDEVYISDGAKRELADLPSLIERTRVYIPDPSYPAYRDVNIAIGNEVHTIVGDNGLLPMPNGKCGCGIYYICSPSNPTGAVYDKATLGAWVDHVRNVRGLIIFDAAYADYIPFGDSDYPRTVYEIDGATECAVEIASFSKSAGFTGLRCGWTVIPRGLCVGSSVDVTPLGNLYERYRAASSNGVAYPVQRAAEAALGGEGQAAVRGLVRRYLENASILGGALDAAGIHHAPIGMSPYIWGDCPAGYDSRGFFEFLLNDCGIISTPGSGFGRAGEGHFRLSAFALRRDVSEAAKRLTAL